MAENLETTTVETETQTTETTEKTTPTVEELIAKLAQRDADYAKLKIHLIQHRPNFPRPRSNLNRK